MQAGDFGLASGSEGVNLPVMSDSPEKTLWSGCPSAALDFWLNLACVLVLPIPWALVRWIQRRNHRIEITTERIRVTTGVFSKRSDELELYRVRDITFDAPFLLRMFGCGTLILNTADTTTPVLTLAGVPADNALRDGLRRAVEECRDRKRARVSELGGVLDVDDPTPGAVGHS